MKEQEISGNCYECGAWVREAWSMYAHPRYECPKCKERYWLYKGALLYDNPFNYFTVAYVALCKEFPGIRDEAE